MPPQEKNDAKNDSNKFLLFCEAVMNPLWEILLEFSFYSRKKQKKKIKLFYDFFGRPLRTTTEVGIRYLKSEFK